jgi:thiol-disulfide isomerase/thioredoxin
MKTFSKKLAAIIVLGFVSQQVMADETEPAHPVSNQPAKRDKSLDIGDPAPPLHVTKWLQGKEVTEFLANKVYVVEFWATWSTPCIAIMPHMAELQAENSDRGVILIAFSAKDPSNTQEKVTRFVEKRGQKLDFTFAFANDRETYDSWVTAARRNNDIPCSFVVGKDGKIAFIGHPMYLDEVLPRIVEGKWTKEDTERMSKVESEVKAVFEAIAGSNAEAGLNALIDFKKRHPKLADIPYFLGPRLTLLIKSSKVSEARKSAEEAIEKAIKWDDPTALSKVSQILRSPLVNNNRELLTLSLQAAQAWFKIAGEKDLFALLNLAETYYVLGDKEKAHEYGAKAVAAAAAESEAIKKYIKQQIKKFDMETNGK